MPYITKDRRLALTPGTAPLNCGELNYALSMLVLECDDCRGLRKEMRQIINSYIELKGLKYQHINDVVGAVVGAKEEMRRRLASDEWGNVFDEVMRSFYDEVAAPYENTKIVENGDLPYGDKA